MLSAPHNNDPIASPVHSCRTRDLGGHILDNAIVQQPEHRSLTWQFYRVCLLYEGSISIVGTPRADVPVPNPTRGCVHVHAFQVPTASIIHDAQLLVGLMMLLACSAVVGPSRNLSGFYTPHRLRRTLLVRIAPPPVRRAGARSRRG